MDHAPPGPGRSAAAPLLFFFSFLRFRQGSERAWGRGGMLVGGEARSSPPDIPPPPDTQPEQAALLFSFSFFSSFSTLLFSSLLFFYLLFSPSQCDAGGRGSWRGATQHGVLRRRNRCPPGRCCYTARLQGYSSV